MPIPEAHEIRPGLQRPYTDLIPTLSRFRVDLPAHLRERRMHLDPDFSHLTYGDANQRAQQLQEHLSAGDLIVFYASLRDTQSKKLVYAIIGLFVVRGIRMAADVAEIEWDINAHSRRVPGPTDLIVCAKAGVSGRLRRCLPIGEYRGGAYRVRRDLLEKWGGLSVKDGWFQRSARLPRLYEPQRFSEWLRAQSPLFMASNN